MILNATSNLVTNVLDWLAQGTESHLGKRLSPSGLRGCYASAYPAAVPAAIQLSKEVPNHFSRTQYRQEWTNEGHVHMLVVWIADLQDGCGRFTILNNNNKDNNHVPVLQGVLGRGL